MLISTGKRVWPWTTSQPVWWKCLDFDTLRTFIEVSVWRTVECGQNSPNQVCLWWVFSMTTRLKAQKINFTWCRNFNFTFIHLVKNVLTSVYPLKHQDIFFVVVASLALRVNLFCLSTLDYPLSPPHLLVATDVRSLNSNIYLSWLFQLNQIKP